jgi:hypothetical protein
MTEEGLKITEESTPSLTVEDLILLVQIIQVCNSRGAFRPEELSKVGGLYDKMILFLDATGAIKKEQSTDQVATLSI